jgi:protein O-mannosyl-transferase
VNEPAPSAEPERPWLLALFALVLTAAVYVQALGGPFIWDDRSLILESAAIREMPWWRFFTQPLWTGGDVTSAAYYRPLVALSFAVDYRLHGENSGGYHLTNLLLHLGASALLFALLRRRGVGLPLTFALTTGWALLPRLTEGAAWISGRADVMAALFTLAAWWLYRPRASVARWTVACAAASLALASKETGLAAFAALATALWQERDPRPPARFVRRCLILALPLAAYAGLRSGAGALGTGESLRLGPLLRAQTVLEAIGRYAWMLIDFLQPRSYLGWLGRPHLGFVVLGALTLVGLGLALRHWRGVANGTGPLLACAAVSLLLVSHVVPLPIAVVTADRYLYLPSAALLLAGAVALERTARARRWLMPAALGVLVAGGVRSFQRIGDYTDEAQFWAAAVEHAPEQPLAVAELGSVAYRAGCFPEALGLYRRALTLDDRRSSIPLENAALLAAVNGEHALARELGERLLQAFPGRPELELRRATVALTALELDTATAHARRALQLAPSSEAARSFLVLLPEVREQLSTVRAGKASASEALSLALRTLRFQEAASALARLLEEPPTDGSALRDGLEFFVAKADPSVAAPLLKRYRASVGDGDGVRLETALAERMAAAENVRAQLRSLSARGVVALAPP